MELEISKLAISRIKKMLKTPWRNIKSGRTTVLTDTIIRGWTLEQHIHLAQASHYLSHFTDLNMCII